MSDIKARVLNIIAKELNVAHEKIVENASFSDDLGADSLDQVELVMALEEEFGIEISDEDQLKIQRVQDAISYIEEHV